MRLLTNKEMAEAFGGYDFRTDDMRAVCLAQVKAVCEMIEKSLLTDEEIEASYTPAPPLYRSEQHREVAQAQLDKILALLKEEGQ